MLIAVALALAFANGANDNFKGVATLHGSGRLGYRAALVVATLSTGAGSLAAAALAATLVRRFGGRGLVPGAVAADPPFLLAVGLGAAATVLLATRFGLPISTTHALVGGLAGAGVALAGARQVAFGVLGRAFLLPLLVSPLLAAALAALARPLLLRIAGRGRATGDEVCLCAQPELSSRPATAGAALAAGISWELRLGRARECEAHAAQPLVTLAARRLLDGLHVASAAAVGFARGLNDTPKLCGLLAGAGLLGAVPGMALLALAIGAGGLAARRVARTLSFGITGMDEVEGLGANLVTAVLVVLATPLGLPVSTTHVSCGALIGVGGANGRARWRAISGIALAWLVTLPLSALLAGLAAWLPRP